MAHTIFALSSGQPPAAIGVIRISGPQAGEVLKRLAGRLPKPRHATLATLCDPEDGDPLDSALLLWFPGPATATGEDLGEIHCHGGRGVTAALLRVLSRQPECRIAEPGEFTRRAFENERIDLNEAEGLADLLLAETEGQRRAAMAMAQGHFSRLVTSWQSELLRLSAMAEAALDFSDEDDVPGEGIEKDTAQGIEALLEAVMVERQRPTAERLRDGIRVVIAGPPNAGKSTLLNALVGRNAAIVSDIAGTTRDRIDVPVALNGVAFLLTDTAGLRDEADDAIEVIGMSRAQDAIEAADILLWLGRTEDAPTSNAIKIAAQSDRPDWNMPEGADIAVSAKGGEGLSALVEMIVGRAARLLPREGEYALHARQRKALDLLAVELDQAHNGHDMLIIAECLRRARQSIDALTGRSGTEDMLDALFGNFCIGK
ncbi:MAG: tRNA uridine-5-carboxymethylaminomethyl(34) synthesis GTPase MnmE [Pseudomonadota bacterium]|jgi:tRNA modification GTPase